MILLPPFPVCWVDINVSPRQEVKGYFSLEVSQVPSLFSYGWTLRRDFLALHGFAGSRYGGSVLFLLTPHLQPQKKPLGLQTHESGLPPQLSSAP